MIQKIQKIQNLGIFYDFSWNSSLDQFKKINVIYGSNGSGKTTLTRLFDCLNEGKSEEYTALLYEVDTENENIKQNKPYERKIKVFNEDYIAKNIQLIEGKAKPIFILGEENRELLKTKEQYEKSLEGKKRRRDEKNDLLTKQGITKQRKFTDIAKIISNTIAGVTKRNYRKPNAENAFKKSA